MVDRHVSAHDGDITLVEGDCVRLMAEMKPESIDAVVCDPPYGLGFMGEEWDRFGEGEKGRALAFQVWCEQWAIQALRVLKPGGHMIAFGGTRTFHRLFCGVEDAGFEVRDTIMWVYGQGWPKSSDVGKGIDRAAGRLASPVAEIKRQLTILFDESGKTRSQIDAECGFRASNYLSLAAPGKRPDPWSGVLPSKEKWQKIKQVIGVADDPDLDAELDAAFVSAEREILGWRKAGPGVAFSSTGPTVLPVTAPATDDAKQWDGWGTAFKPAFEPILVARKAPDGSILNNVVRWGTGALNINGCRVGATKEVPVSPRRAVQGAAYGDLSHGSGLTSGFDPNTGRWPANVVLSHTRACEMVGTRSDRFGGGASGSSGFVQGYTAGDGFVAHEAEVDLWNCAPGCPVQDLNRQSGLSASGTAVRHRSGGATFGSKVAKPPMQDMGYDDFGGASRFFNTFAYDDACDVELPVCIYTSKASRSERDKGLNARNPHPTIKPIALMRHLVRLVTPPEGLVLDPFMGSGTTMLACLEEGARGIGMEKDQTFFEVACARVRHHSVQQTLFG